MSNMTEFKQLGAAKLYLL